MKKKLLALLMVFAVVLESPVFAQEDLTENAAENEIKTVYEYSNYMKKNMVRVYAHSIADNFYYGIDDEELLFAVICDAIDKGEVNIDSAVKAMIDQLDDDHAAFFTREEYDGMTEEMAGEFSGIGVLISQNDNGIVVLSVYEDSPAERGGIQEGDYIIAVGGQSTEEMSTTEVRNLIVGISGSDIEITLLRRGEKIKTVCTRGQVTVKHTQTKMLDGNIGYLRITEFVRTLPNEVEAYIKELQENRVSKLVLDLRDNPGGDLDAAVSIANMFISAGQIAQLRYKNSENDETIYSNNYHAPKLKIAVLVNENSASASEFLTMAFKTRKAAKIIGTQTYGKGSMQTVRRIATGAGMKFTIGEFYSINGERINTIGITPDIVVENEMIPIDEESFVKIDFDRVDEGTQNTDMTLALEERLNALGYMEESPDEIFDENTKDAVKRLQTVIGYDNTGIPGFYEYLYLNDVSYDFSTEKDNQLSEALNYLGSLK